MNSVARTLAAVSTVALAVLALVPGAWAGTVVVTSASDAAEPEQGSLRWALETAQDGDIVQFDESLSGEVVRLYDTPGNAGKDTSFTISNKVLTVKGPSGGVTIDGGWPWVFGSRSDLGSRIFLVKGASGKVSFSNITFKGGHSRGWVATGEFYQGGAVCSDSPIRFDNCSFVQNGSADYPQYAPTIRGGGAIFTTSDLELYGCSMISNVIITGSTSYAGAIVVNGGSLVVSNCVLKANKSASYCGCIYLTNVSKAEFVDSVITDSTCPGGNGVHAACIWATSIDSARMVLKRCAFRNNRMLSSGGYAGAIYLAGVQLLVDSCEFTDCSAGCGGAIRNDNSQAVVVNSTFYGNSSASWGGQFDVRTQTYFINCTFAGGYANGESDSQNGAAAVRVYCNDAYLNTVMAYNYLRPELYMNKDHGNLNGSTTRLNSIYDGTDAAGGTLTLAATLEGATSASALFASYRESDTVPYLGSTATLSSSVVFPEMEALGPEASDRPRVIPIAEGGLLDGTGYPVKANADYTYVAYSTDGGDSWTTLFGTDDGTAQLIAADQRGVPYRGRIPIGAAARLSESGLMVIIQ